uniref:Uncharacterized protein n=1 Tax=Anopheles atroparvus TaxID=41427 RepID=A0AAG5DIT5_ANOAO
MFLGVDAMLAGAVVVMVVMMMVMSDAVRYVPQGRPGQDAAHAERTAGGAMSVVPIAGPVARSDRVRVPVKRAVVVVVVVSRCHQGSSCTHRIRRMLMVANGFSVARRVHLRVRVGRWCASSRNGMVPQAGISRWRPDGMAVRVAVHAPTDGSRRLDVRNGWIPDHSAHTLLVNVMVVLARVPAQRCARVVIALAAHSDGECTLSVDRRYTEQDQVEGKHQQDYRQTLGVCFLRVTRPTTVRHFHRFYPKPCNTRYLLEKF